MESPSELKFVKEIVGDNETPRKDDVLVIGDVSFTVTGIERNYDHHAIVVYVSRNKPMGRER